MVGCLVNYAGDRLIGYRIELVPMANPLEIFYNPLFFLELFVWPVVVGMSVAMVFGLGGKWLCYFPPFIVRSIAYIEMNYLVQIPEGYTIMPVGWWIFFVILAVECAALGGVFGEVIVKRTYGRTPPEEAHKIYLKSGEHKEAHTSE